MAFKYTLEDLSPEQATAIKEYAEKKGRYWKRALLQDWATGKDEGYLRQIRNNFGPAWLNLFRINKEQ